MHQDEIRNDQKHSNPSVNCFSNDVASEQDSKNGSWHLNRNDTGMETEIFEDDLSFLYLSPSEFSNISTNSCSSNVINPAKLSLLSQTMTHLPSLTPSSYQSYNYPLSRTELMEAITPKIDLSELRDLLLHAREDVPELSGKIQEFIVLFLEVLNQKIAEKKYLEVMIEKKIENYNNEMYQFYEETEKQVMLEKEKLIIEFKNKEFHEKLEAQKQIKTKEYEIEMLLKKSFELEERLKEMNAIEVEAHQTNRKLQKEKSFLAEQLEESQRIQDILSRHLARIQQNVSKSSRPIKNESTSSIFANVAAEKDYLTQQLDLLREYNRKLLDDKDELEARDLSCVRYSPTFPRSRPLQKHGSVLGDYFANDLFSATSLHTAPSQVGRFESLNSFSTLPDGNGETLKPTRSSSLFHNSTQLSEAFKLVNNGPISHRINFLSKGDLATTPSVEKGFPAFKLFSSSALITPTSRLNKLLFTPTSSAHRSVIKMQQRKLLEKQRAGSSPSLIKTASRPLMSRFRSLAPILDVVPGINFSSSPTLTEMGLLDYDEMEFALNKGTNNMPHDYKLDHFLDEAKARSPERFPVFNMADFYGQQILTKIQSRKKVTSNSTNDSLKLRRTKSQVDPKNQEEFSIINFDHTSSLRRVVSGSDVTKLADFVHENTNNSETIKIKPKTVNSTRSYAHIASVMDPLQLPSTTPSLDCCRASPLGASISSDSGLNLKKDESSEDFTPDSPDIKRTPKLTLRPIGIAQNLLVRKSLIRNEPKRVFKVILVGDLGVGKSTFIHMACHHQFCDSFVPTLGMDFQMKSIDINGQLVALQIWDTAGQEKFRALTRHYYRKADAILLMYDISYPKSFENLKLWINEIGKNLKCFKNDPSCCSVLYRPSAIDDIECMIMEQNMQKPVFALLANKMDLIDAPSSTLTSKDILVLNRSRNLANDLDALHFEVSAKTGRNVESAFHEITKLLCSHEDMFLNTPRFSAIRLESLNSLSKTKRGKCGCYKN